MHFCRFITSIHLSKLEQNIEILLPINIVENLLEIRFDNFLNYNCTDQCVSTQEHDKNSKAILSEQIQSFNEDIQGKLLQTSIFDLVQDTNNIGECSDITEEDGSNFNSRKIITECIESPDEIIKGKHCCDISYLYEDNYTGEHDGVVKEDELLLSEVAYNMIDDNNTEGKSLSYLIHFNNRVVAWIIFEINSTSNVISELIDFSIKNIGGNLCNRLLTT